MRLKRAMGSGRKFSTHNALWCLFTHCGELWVVRGKVSSVELFLGNVEHHADEVQTLTGNMSECKLKP